MSGPVFTERINLIPMRDERCLCHQHFRTIRQASHQRDFCACPVHPVYFTLVQVVQQGGPNDGLVGMRRED